MTRRNQKAEDRRQKRIVALCLFLVSFATALVAKNGAYPSTAHGNRDSGPQRRNDIPRGSCMQCHVQHSGHAGTLPSQNFELFAPNDSNFCLECHTNPSSSGTFPGNAAWSESPHALAPSLWSPKNGARLSESDNRCIVCHEPHGNKDNNGVIPSLLGSRSPDLCFTCHDGARASNIRREYQKAYAHASRARGEHHSDEGGDPTRFSAVGGNRHADCDDCHNPHQVGSEPASPASSSEASSRLAGVSRVEVVNGGAGSLPNYRFLTAGDPGDVREYEVCFKCHSSWTKQPVGQEDIARLTNPANPSFHPIQGPGRNTRIDPESFVNGWAVESRLTCSSCHASDDPTIRGPHGSTYQYLLKAPVAVRSDETMQSTDLCFDCHDYRAYADASSDPIIQKTSRFNAPAGNGHAFHVGSQHLACYSCHDVHGSTRNPALITSTHSPGITTFIQTPNGGTCMSSCHQARTYTVNYPR